MAFSSLKRRAARIAKWPGGRLTTLFVVAIVLSLAAGAAAGFAVERHRVHSANARNGALLAGGVQAIGKVRVVSAKAFTVRSARGVAMRFEFAPAGTILQASPGHATDIVAGARVVYLPGGHLTAKEVVVLEGAQARIGRLVTAATATSMTIRVGAKTVTLATAHATVDVVKTGTRADVTKGATMIAHGRRLRRGAVAATEVVVLPARTAFA